MTPSQQAKSVGLKSLTQVSKITGVSLNTLTNWHRDKPELFSTVLNGCSVHLKGEAMDLLDFQQTRCENVFRATGRKGEYFLNVGAWSHLDLLVISDSGPKLVRINHYCTKEEGIEAASRFDMAEDE